MRIELSLPASHWPEQIAGRDRMLKSANNYFRSRAIEHVDGARRYCKQYGGILKPLSEIEATEIFKRHQDMMFRVVDARRFLADEYQDDLADWQNATAADRAAYKDFFAVKIAQDSNFRGWYFEGDEEGFVSDCFNTIQWLDGWLRSEFGSVTCL